MQGYVARLMRGVSVAAGLLAGAAPIAAQESRSDAAQQLIDQHLNHGNFRPESVEKVLTFARTNPDDPSNVGILTAVATALQDMEQNDKALKLLDEGAEILDGRPDVDSLRQTRREFSIVGQTLPIVGPTIDQSNFDIRQEKGKVVLVDFWATWCGPCVREMPNVQKLHEKYGKKGFEVVGVSLDQDEDELEFFVRKRRMRWKQILFHDARHRGWSNPLAEKLQVTSIPAMFLVGRHGKVVATNVRGERLERLVDRHVNRRQPAMAN